MAIAARLRGQEREMFLEVDRFIEGFKSTPMPQAKKEANEALIRTGVIHKSGKAKDRIVSWE